jgi:hypothetical protein
VTLPPLRAVTLPPGLQAGDQYRLVFVTTNETYGWKGAAAGAFTNFTQYHDFAASEAASGPALNALGTTWKAVVATRTPSSNARANTETDPAANGTGVPIYNLAGQPVALDNADLWDGSILNPINVTQLGTGPTPQRNGQYLVWTGITDDAGNGNGDWSLITPSGNYINAGCATNVNLNWARGMGGSEFKSDLMPIYVMSGILAYPASLTNCDMQSFNWGSYNGVINGTNISLTVPFGTSVTNLNPACTAAAYASISPVSGSARNFSSPLLYTVTAADGVTTKTYLVTVTVAAPSTNCDLLSLNWGAASGSFNGTNITLLVPPGTDVTALNPTCAISPFATSAPLSGTANDFTSPVNYTITAQDGISRKTYQVTARFALSVSVASSSDDAEEAASGSVSLTSSDLELVNDGTAGDQKIGVRFAGLNIPPGWLVASAIIQFTADETQSETTSLTIRAQAADNAPTFSTTNWGISTRPVTSSSVSWQPPAWNTVGEAGPAQQTPDLAALLQEVVNRPGWLEGNAVAFILTGTGHRTADSFDKAGGTPARLIVTFQRPAPPPAVLGIERAGSGALALTWPASHMVFTLYTTTNLPTSNWVRVMADRVLSNGVWILPLGRATNGQRFYRLQTP